MSAIIGIEIDRKTGKVISADMPPADIDVKALWDRELKPSTLFEQWVLSLGGDLVEPERVREHRGGSCTVPAVQKVYPEHDPV